METNYYEYIGTQKQSDKYADPKPILGNIYPCDAKIGGEEVSFWLISTSLRKEWKLVEKEQSTEELIELLNKKASKDGLICSVTFEKKPGIEITDFETIPTCFKGTTSLSILINLEVLKVAIKEKQLIEAIKTVLEND
jgi:uncharacterized protein YuzB (UPF0349 family)